MLPLCLSYDIASSTARGGSLHRLFEQDLSDVKALV